MKSIIAVVLVLFATTVWGTPVYPPGPEANASAKAEATAIGVGIGKGGNATATGGQGIGSVTVTGPTQGVTITPAPVVVQETPRAIAGALPYMAQPNPPYLQPEPLDGGGTRGPQSYTPRTPGSRASIWVDGGLYNYADLPMGELSSDVEIRGVKFKSTGKQRAKLPADFVVYKNKSAKRGTNIKYVADEVIWTGMIKAKNPGMIYAELEMEAMNFARSIGGSGINELDRHFDATTTQSGWAPQLGLLGSIVGSAFGQGALWGPSAGVTYQSYVANTKVTYYIEFEVLR